LVSRRLNFEKSVRPCALSVIILIRSV
jgi:hypothetical protein